MTNTIHHNPRPVAHWPDAPPQHRGHRNAPVRRRLFPALRPSLCPALLLAAIFLCALMLVPTPARAQEESDTFTDAEVCAQVAAVFGGMDDDARQMKVRLNELGEELEALQGLAALYVEYINPNVTSDENRRFQVLFWIVTIQMQGVNSEIRRLEAAQAELAFDRDIFTQIAAAFACGEEEEEAPAHTARLQSSCNVRTGSVINWDKLNEMTFVVVEDPAPAQDDIRWIEFRVALTNDPGQRNPSIWLERAIAWAEEKKSEGWVELARGNVTGFCNAIGAACITPPAGISPNTFARLCGGD